MNDVFKRHLVIALLLIGLLVLALYNLAFCVVIVNLSNILIYFFFFLFAFNSRKLSMKSGFIILAIAFLWTGIFDILHLFSLDNINVLNSDSNELHQYWISARIIESAFILIGFIFYKYLRKVNDLYIIAVISITLILFIIFSNILPPLYFEGSHTVLFYVFDITVLLSFLIIIIFIKSNKELFPDHSVIATAMSLKLISEFLYLLTHGLDGYIILAPQLVRLGANYILLTKIVIDSVRNPFKSVFKVFETREEKLIHLSKTDQLTGVQNHTAILNSLEKCIDKQREDKKKSIKDIAIMMLDINKFKAINDTFGHQKGDEILIIVSFALQNSIGYNDEIGRYGGDEFLIVLKDGSDSYIDETIMIINDNIGCLSKDINMEITLSIGISVSENEISASELIKRADLKMYEAKKHLSKNYIKWSKRD